MIITTYNDRVDISPRTSPGAHITVRNTDSIDAGSDESGVASATLDPREIDALIELLSEYTDTEWVRK